MATSVLGGLARKPLTDTPWRDAQRMLDLGRACRDRANALANAAYADTRSTQFVESWANLTAWSSATAVKVVSGRVYGNAGGGASGINHSLAGLIPTTGTMRAVTTISVPSGTASTSGGIMIGVTSDTAGAAFTAGGTTLKGLYLHYVGGFLDIEKMDNGVNSASTNTSHVTGLPQTLTVTLTIDANYYSIVATNTNGTQEWRAQWARGSVTPNNLAIFNSHGDTALTGMSVGPLAVVPAMSTASPRFAAGGNIEGQQRTTVWTSNPTATGMIRASLPKNYDARIPTPWVLMWHGHGSNETHWADNANGSVVANALLAAGFIVIGFASSSTTPWGAQAELDAGYGAFLYARENFNLGPGLFYCNSMGSIDGLLALAERRIPGVMGYVGTSPTFDLAANYANATFTASIKAAYGIAADGSDYAAKTAGHDPALMDPALFRGVPALILAASDDTTVTPAANAIPLKNALTPYAPELLAKVDNTGGHSFDFTPFTLGTSPYDIVNFAKRCTAA